MLTLRTLRTSTRAASFAEYAVLSGVLGAAVIGSVLTLGGEAVQGTEAGTTALTDAFYTAEAPAPAPTVPTLPDGDAGGEVLPPPPPPVLAGYEFGPFRGVWLPSPLPAGQYITGADVWPVESLVVRTDNDTNPLPFASIATGDRLGAYTIVAATSSIGRVSVVETVPGDPGGLNITVRALGFKVAERPGEIFYVPHASGSLGPTAVPYQLSGSVASFQFPGASTQLANWTYPGFYVSGLPGFPAAVEVFE